MFPIISSTTVEPSYDELPALVPFREARPTGMPAKRPRDSRPADEIVVSNGDVFHIHFIDEPPIDEDLPSSTCPIVQPNNQLFDEADGSCTYTDELAVDRDWINYDELPMLSKHNSVAPTSHGESAHANVEAHDSGALRGPSLLISAESSGWPETEATIMHITPVLSVEPTNQANGTQVSSGGSKRRRNRRRKTTKPSTTGVDSDSGWHGFRNYCVECSKFFPTAADLELHMEFCHRLVDDLPQSPSRSMMLVDDLAMCDNRLLEPHFNDTPGSWPQAQANHVPHAREMESFYSDLFHKSANEFR
ncbi:hypothetical protein AND_001337 [Anopheles darlingi]|uniref:C2H2-type domain-containing protein n=1 Tax=Anopheles darlingi TaxID=43151 RepID=W5JVK6_ANODA|nr:hypothetical protein AND_001337 [Anopheles darlingi]